MNFRILARATGSIAAVLVAASAFAAAASAPAQDPVQWLREGVDEVMKVVYDSPNTDQPLSQRIRPTLEKHFDLEGLTMRAVGPGWRRLTPEQRKRVEELFSDLVLRTYADRFEPKERPTIHYGQKMSLPRGSVELPTQITYQGQTYAVSYRLHPVDGEWRIYDVIIEGVSMIQNYRGQFHEILVRGGADALISQLEQSLANLAPPK